MNQTQTLLLINLITDIAEAVVSDSQSRGSDYQGMELHRIKENAEKWAEEFNNAKEAE